MGFRTSSTRLASASDQAARGLYGLRDGSLRPLRLGRDAPSPGRRLALLTPFLRSPEPCDLSAAGVSLESLRFGYRARNRSALDPGKLLTDASDGASAFRAKKPGEEDLHSSNEASWGVATCFHQMKNVIHHFQEPASADPIPVRSQKSAYKGYFSHGFVMRGCFKKTN